MPYIYVLLCIKRQAFLIVELLFLAFPRGVLTEKLMPTAIYSIYLNYECGHHKAF